MAGDADIHRHCRQTLAMAILQEQAEDLGKPWYRGFIDFAGFFQSVVRRVQEMVEAKAGVAPQVTEVVVALHDSLQVAVDTGERVSPAVASLTGNGQQGLLPRGRRNRAACR